MTPIASPIAAAVRALRHEHRLPVVRDGRGPVLLARFFEELAVRHVGLPELTRSRVAAYLRAQGTVVEDLGAPHEPLAGFVFVAGRVGWAFVCTGAGNPLGRQRFSAAHELAHFVLHRQTMGRFRADTDATLREADGDTGDQMEKEANRFAAELLMPAEVCEARAAEMRRQHGCCPRGVLSYMLAAELLVSREAMRYRLSDLEVGDE